MSILLISCNKTSQTRLIENQPQKIDLNQVLTLMEGTFTSAAQAAKDTNFYDITLQMYQIWPERNDKYLYVEQAVTTMTEKPYRQRIYRVTTGPNNTIISYVYKLKDEAKFIGQWRQPAFFDSYDLDLLEIREGCAVYLSLQANGEYVGSTKERACKSTLRGASYATSKVSLLPNKIVSWDQGFDSNDQQVWGATSGGYEFVRE